MRIGIDIDGVLTDIEQWQLDYGSKYYYNKLNKGIRNHNQYETLDIFESTPEEDDLFWYDYFEDYSRNVRVRDLAAEVIKKLRDAGNEIFIITARGNMLSHSAKALSYEDNKLIVKDWLSKNKIVYDQLLFTMEEKLNVCIDNNIDIMIEDKPQGIIDISTKIPVICFHASYNENCKNDNIYRCYSWYDILYTINEIIK